MTAIDEFKRMLKTLRKVKSMDFVSSTQYSTIFNMLRMLNDLYNCESALSYANKLPFVVTPFDKIMPEHHNFAVDAIKAFRDCVSKVKDTKEIDKIISNMRYVSKGDIILPDDKNTIIDALTWIANNYPFAIKPVHTYGCGSFYGTSNYYKTSIEPPVYSPVYNCYGFCFNYTTQRPDDCEEFYYATQYPISDYLLLHHFPLFYYFDYDVETGLTTFSSFTQFAMPLWIFNDVTSPNNNSKSVSFAYDYHCLYVTEELNTPVFVPITDAIYVYFENTYKRVLELVNNPNSLTYAYKIDYGKFNVEKGFAYVHSVAISRDNRYIVLGIIRKTINTNVSNGVLGCSKTCFDIIVIDTINDTISFKELSCYDDYNYFTSYAGINVLISQDNVIYAWIYGIAQPYDSEISLNDAYGSLYAITIENDTLISKEIISDILPLNDRNKYDGQLTLRTTQITLDNTSSYCVLYAYDKNNDDFYLIIANKDRYISYNKFELVEKIKDAVVFVELISSDNTSAKSVQIHMSDFNNALPSNPNVPYITTILAGYGYDIYINRIYTCDDGLIIDCYIVTSCLNESESSITLFVPSLIKFSQSAFSLGVFDVEMFVYTCLANVDNAVNLVKENISHSTNPLSFVTNYESSYTEYFARPSYSVSPRFGLFGSTIPNDVCIVMPIVDSSGNVHIYVYVFKKNESNELYRSGELFTDSYVSFLKSVCYTNCECQNFQLTTYVGIEKFNYTVPRVQIDEFGNIIDAICYAYCDYHYCYEQPPVVNHLYSTVFNAYYPYEQFACIPFLPTNLPPSSSFIPPNVLVYPSVVCMPMPY